MSIYPIIQELRSTRSKLEKEAILNRNKDNEDLKTFFRLSLSPYINFFQKKKFTYGGYPTGTLRLGDVMSWLELVISTRQLTGNAAANAIQTRIDLLSQEDAELIMAILQKKPDCGVTSTANKVWPGIVPEWPCFLASPYSDKLANALNWLQEQISQLKSDGLRVNIIVDAHGGVTAYTRAGNVLEVFGRFDFLGDLYTSVVFDGELLTINPETQKFNNRQTSNGICSKAIKNTMSQEEANMLHLVTWDLIPLEAFEAREYKVPYKKRLEALQQEIQEIMNYGHGYKLSLVPTRWVKSIEEAQEHYAELQNQGEEGSMLKDPEEFWADIRSKRVLKLKSETTADMKVIGFKAGVGKFEGNLGSLEMSTEDSKCVASMSGFSLKLRSEIYANLTGKPIQYMMVIDGVDTVLTANPGDVDITIGSIVEIKFNQKIKARDTEIWSLFLPRFSKVRKDKTVANNVDDF
jgi:ATP-dependent DNA ligase